MSYLRASSCGGDLWRRVFVSVDLVLPPRHQTGKLRSSVLSRSMRFAGTSYRIGFIMVERLVLGHVWAGGPEVMLLVRRMHFFSNILTPIILHPFRVQFLFWGGIKNSRRKSVRTLFLPRLGSRPTCQPRPRNCGGGSASTTEKGARRAFAVRRELVEW